jgi:hypothetical protein
VEELAQQRGDEFEVVAFQRLVERQRQFGGERERGRRVQRDADRAVGLLRDFRGG